MANSVPLQVQIDVGSVLQTGREIQSDWSVLVEIHTGLGSLAGAAQPGMDFDIHASVMKSSMLVALDT